MKKQLTSKEKSEFTLILSLISFLLGKREEVSVSPDTDFKSIISISERNSITNMVSYALTKANAPVPKDIKDALVYRQKYMLMKDAHQYSATKKLISALERAGVNNLLVKGEFLKNTYPQPDYRVTADVDIHINAQDFSTVKQVAQELDFGIGYEGESLMIVYQEPFSEFEIHGDNGEFADTVFGENLFEKAVLLKGTNHTYRFSDEDHFIYIIEHFAKHYRDVSGMGVRMVLDVYCLYNSYKEKLNFDYIKTALKKSGIYNFYKMLLAKGKKYFEEDVNSSEFDIVDIFILTNGIMGTKEIMAYNGKRKYQESYGKSKNYTFNRAFPPVKRMIEEYPVLEKHRIFLPVFWVHRGAKIVFGKDRKQYFENMETYRKYNDDEEMAYLQKVMKKSGF